MRTASNISLLVLAGILSACTGSLTEEQRRAVKEDMESHAIRKVSDAEITEAAFARGRQLITQLETAQSDSAKLDSIMNSSAGKIRWLVPGSSNALEVEQQLIDAYIASAATDVQDNIQKIRGSNGTQSDSILYTKPVVMKQKDGTEVLAGVWNIWLSRKELIRGMN